MAKNMKNLNEQEELHEMTAWLHLLPEFAPLPQPFVDHLVHNPQRVRFERARFRHDPTRTQSDIHQLWELIQLARERTLIYLDPLVGRTLRHPTTDLSVGWVRTHFPVFDDAPLELKEKMPSRSAIGDWQAKNLLRNKRYGAFEENSVASLLMMRYLSHTRRDWLPVSQEEEEPRFWVWGLAPQESLPRRYPYPLPLGMTANTLLWSSWPGIAWEPGWRRIDHRGALAWAGTLQFPERGQWYWNLSEADLNAWDLSLTRTTLETVNAVNTDLFPGYPLGNPNNAQASPDDQIFLFHTLADLILVRYGTRILQRALTHYYTASVPPQDSLVFDDFW
jgi:hypothetical protein